MLGFNSFGVYPFGAIANIIGNYYGMTSNESMSISDALSVRGAFVNSQTDGQILTDSSSSFAGFVSFQIDGQTLLDFLYVQGDFTPTYIEPMQLTDYQFGGGWFKIWDAQSPNWTLIDNTQK